MHALAAPAGPVIGVRKTFPGANPALSQRAEPRLSRIVGHTIDQLHVWRFDETENVQF